VEVNDREGRTDTIPPCFDDSASLGLDAAFDCRDPTIFDGDVDPHASVRQSRVSDDQVKGHGCVLRELALPLDVRDHQRLRVFGPASDDA
jgi:hypothetical protein